MEQRDILPTEARLHLTDHLTKYEEIQILSAQVGELKLLLSAAQEEISMLTEERDEVVAAIKRWSKAGPDERRELLYDTTTQELRTEMKLLRTENKRLRGELIVLKNGQNEVAGPRRMRA